jgi:hypothetical protein
VIPDRKCFCARASPAQFDYPLKYIAAIATVSKYVNVLVVPPTPPVNTVAGLEWVTVRIDASQKRV